MYCIASPHNLCFPSVSKSYESLRYFAIELLVDKLNNAAVIQPTGKGLVLIWKGWADILWFLDFWFVGAAFFIQVWRFLLLDSWLSKVAELY